MHGGEIIMKENYFKICTNYKTQENKGEIIEYVKNFINENDEVIIINIGTDRCLGDSVAPIVGTILHENNCPLKVYGDLDNPIHALNMDDKLEEIYKNHPNAKIIGIDACLGDKEDIGLIQMRETSIKCGRGVGKVLPHVGNISLIGIVDTSEDFELFANKSIRLSLIYNISKLISEIILMSCDLISKDIKFYNRNKNTYESKGIILEKEVAIN